jgi:hypothetical protein
MRSPDLRKRPIPDAFLQNEWANRDAWGESHERPNSFKKFGLFDEIIPQFYRPRGQSELITRRSGTSSGKTFEPKQQIIVQNQLNQ